MWVYKFIDSETRTQVPSFWTFLRSNHDLIRMWLENTSEPLSERLNFTLRVMKWITSVCILFLFVCFMINPQGDYYTEQCFKR